MASPQHTLKNAVLEKKTHLALLTTGRLTRCTKKSSTQYKLKPAIIQCADQSYMSTVQRHRSTWHSKLDSHLATGDLKGTDPEPSVVCVDGVDLANLRHRHLHLVTLLLVEQVHLQESRRQDDKNSKDFWSPYNYSMALTPMVLKSQNLAQKARLRLEKLTFMTPVY